MEPRQKELMRCSVWGEKEWKQRGKEEKKKRILSNWRNSARYLMGKIDVTAAEIRWASDNLERLKTKSKKLEGRHRELQTEIEKAWRKCVAARLKRRELHRKGE
jgi:predicted RNase H-like nuclease (RuvC/YqgF family)